MTTPEAPHVYDFRHAPERDPRRIRENLRLSRAWLLEEIRKEHELELEEARRRAELEERR